MGAQTAAIGALLLPAAFLMGVKWGVEGLAWAWVAVWPLFLLITAARSLPVIGLSWRDWLGAILPPVSAAVAMALIVGLVDRLLPPLAPLPHLALLTATGGGGLWCLALVLRARDGGGCDPYDPAVTKVRYLNVRLP
ncbi:polysaccharide biosynthesis C-terminal domain-containing protein [Sphingomonas sp. J344]|uniref:polysaccharide biosynthesis C-terminal domain-containing protein n=1 Tax=Sphingomonas sp. J344 TaxID=2898434 RepID=UPI0027E39A19|nr:polysaccharide biosynthesis C-terminal domain-containing protein [Sphingomonas sp. J344]